ncbi:MAG TPA: hypothetical protein VFA21_17770 [Pyrinomonadaceae bacterium]|nr:hypothetical protein [Pyrinomonadaceae bacterium]
MEHLYEQFMRENQFLAGFSPRTIKLFRWVFNRWNAHMGEVMPDKQNVKDWVIRLNKSGVKPMTINSYARAFNSFRFDFYGLLSSLYNVKTHSYAVKMSFYGVKTHFYAVKKHFYKMKTYFYGV